MRFPMCRRYCHYGELGHYDPLFDPYVLCDYYYSSSFFTSTRKEMATSMQSRLPSIPGSPLVISTPSPSILTQGVTMSVNPVGSQTNITMAPISTVPIQGAPIGSKLTIYSGSGHIVQKFPQGTKNIILPKSVEIASIVAVDSDGIIIPFSYVPETNMGIALTNRSTGEKVEATVIKEGQTITGKILSLDLENVMLMTGSHITNIRKYDQIIVGITEDLTRPRLMLERDSKSLTLSYLLSSIAWTCVGTALIDNVKNIMYLRLAGNITNNTESDIRANTTLVSGEVYQYRSHQEVFAEAKMYSAPRASSAALMTSRKVQTAILEDYIKYEVGDRLVRNQDIAELGTWSFPVIKLYINQTNDNDIFIFGYRFIAPGYIPSCSLNVYSIDSNKEIDAYLGSNEIKESQKSDEVDIILGESTLLQCKSLVVISNDVIVNDESTMNKFKLPTNVFINGQSEQIYGQQQQQIVKGGKYIDGRRWHVITEDLKVEIKNHNDRPVSLVLKHFVWNKHLVETRCQSYKDRKNGFIEWYFEVPPRTSPEPRKEKFACQIITASYY
jgi:hypothetical protein